MPGNVGPWARDPARPARLPRDCPRGRTGECTSDPAYALPRFQQECQRLSEQAAFLGGTTNRVFAAPGIQPAVRSHEVAPAWARCPPARRPRRPRRRGGGCRRRWRGPRGRTWRRAAARAAQRDLGRGRCQARGAVRTITQMCSWLGVSKSGFHGWRTRPTSADRGPARAARLQDQGALRSPTTTPTGIGGCTPRRTCSPATSPPPHRSPTWSRTSPHGSVGPWSDRSALSRRPGAEQPDSGVGGGRCCGDRQPCGREPSGAVLQPGREWKQQREGREEVAGLGSEVA